MAIRTICIQFQYNSEPDLELPTSKLDVKLDLELTLSLLGVKHPIKDLEQRLYVYCCSEPTWSYVYCTFGVSLKLIQLSEMFVATYTLQRTISQRDSHMTNKHEPGGIDIKKFQHIRCNMEVELISKIIATSIPQRYTSSCFISCTQASHHYSCLPSNTVTPPICYLIPQATI